MIMNMQNHKPKRLYRNAQEGLLQLEPGIEFMLKHSPSRKIEEWTYVWTCNDLIIPIDNFNVIEQIWFN